VEAGTVFLSLVLILLTARVLGEAAAWLKVPPVMGEMLAGIILGPSLLGWVELNEVIQTLAEIGLILLLFEVGLDTDLSRLVKTGRKASAVALGGFVAPLVTGFALSYWLFDLSLLLSLFIGGTLTATSIGVTVRVLRDLKRHKSQEAQVVIAAAVFDDILGVVLLALLYEFSLYGGISLINAGKVLIFIAVFMLLAPIVAKVMADTIGRYNRRSKIAGLIPTTIVTLVMFFAWLPTWWGHRRCWAVLPQGSLSPVVFFSPLLPHWCSRMVPLCAGSGHRCARSFNCSRRYFLSLSACRLICRRWTGHRLRYSG